MLTVAAARLEESYASPKLIADLREAAKHEAKCRARGETRDDAEDRRIGRQRTLMAMVPDTRAKDSLMAAMLQRAYDLMWDGDGLSCDAITEFLPSLSVEKMFAAWENDLDGRHPRSSFYGDSK